MSLRLATPQISSLDESDYAILSALRRARNRIHVATAGKDSVSDWNKFGPKDVEQMKDALKKLLDPWTSETSSKLFVFLEPIESAETD